MQQVGIIWSDIAIVTTLKEMVASIMTPIEPLDVSGAEPLHRLFQIGPSGSDKKVVMIIHHT